MEREFTRSELADYLESVAADLRAGTMEVDGRKWTIPPVVVAKVAIKEKTGRLAAKLKWGWSTLEEYEHEARQEVAQWRDSFKQVKKELSALFKQLREKVEAGELPDSRSVSAFVEQCRAFSRFAEPEWTEATKEFMDHLENFQRATLAGNFELVAHELRDLGNRKRACHTERI